MLLTRGVNYVSKGFQKTIDDRKRHVSSRASGVTSIPGIIRRQIDKMLSPNEIRAISVPIIRKVRAISTVDEIYVIREKIDEIISKSPGLNSVDTVTKVRRYIFVNFEAADLDIANTMGRRNTIRKGLLLDSLAKLINKLSDQDKTNKDNATAAASLSNMVPKYDAASPNDALLKECNDAGYGTSKTDVDKIQNESDRVSAKLRVYEAILSPVPGEIAAITTHEMVRNYVLKGVVDINTVKCDKEKHTQNIHVIYTALFRLLNIVRNITKNHVLEQKNESESLALMKMFNDATVKDYINAVIQNDAVAVVGTVDTNEISIAIQIIKDIYNAKSNLTTDGKNITGHELLKTVFKFDSFLKFTYISNLCSTLDDNNWVIDAVVPNISSGDSKLKQDYDYVIKLLTDIRQVSQMKNSAPDLTVRIDHFVDSIINRLKANVTNSEINDNKLSKYIMALDAKTCEKALTQIIKEQNTFLKKIHKQIDDNHTLADYDNINNEYKNILVDYVFYRITDTDNVVDIDATKEIVVPVYLEKNLTLVDVNAKIAGGKRRTLKKRPKKTAKYQPRIIRKSSRMNKKRSMRR
jgi:hypothetical protein